MCDLQDPVNYTMELLNDQGSVEAMSGLKIARGIQGTVSTVFTGNLPVNIRLSVRVSFSHSAMSWTSQSVYDRNISNNNCVGLNECFITKVSSCSYKENCNTSSDYRYSR